MRTRQAPALLGQKILVTIDKWDITSRYPEGHFVRALGKVESKEAEQESLLLEFDVPYRPFGKAILDCLPSEGEQWVVPPKRESDPIWRNREDLRQLNICSIDPPGAYIYLVAGRSHNRPLAKVVKILMTLYMPVDCQVGILKQASVSVMNLFNQIFLCISDSDIADVSHFVLPDNPMDVEAAARGTTVYLVDKRIDMLPALLGTNLCSLRPFVERLAFSVIWVSQTFLVERSF